jgi:hypothetical protein
MELPKPSSITAQQQIDDFGAYTDGLDKVLDSYISSEWMTDSTVGSISSDIDTYKKLVKAYYQRKWLSDKGIMTELSELVSLGEDGKPLLNLSEVTEQHLDALIESGVLDTIKALKKSIDKNNKRLEDMGAAVGDGSSNDNSDDGTIDEPQDSGDPSENMDIPKDEPQEGEDENSKDKKDDVPPEDLL